MTWEEARQRSITKWNLLLDLMAVQDKKTFLQETAEACAFCEKAIDLWTQAGRVTRIQCPFCEAYIQTGGCRHPIDNLQMAVADDDWDSARQQVEAIIQMLQRLDLPIEESIADR
ncbi:MAG: hypothetical protein HY710_02860 [Candidatus Latescibacteria bacterium]|nr:hypothetical protein [Candidatus Latescibacterota bacterium]